MTYRHPMRNSHGLQTILLLLALAIAAGVPVRASAWQAQIQSALSRAKSSSNSANFAHQGAHGTADAAAPFLGQGLRALQEERYHDAIEAFRHALKLNPRLTMARYDLGVSYFALERFDEAKEAFEEVLHQDPQHDFARYFLARVNLVQGNLDAAIRGFETLPRQKPVADELYYLGAAYFRKGDTERAIQALKRASAWKPSDYRANLLLARAYQKLGRAREAEEQLALSEKLRDPDRRESRALVECTQSLLSQSEAVALERCRQLLDGDDPEQLTSLGVLLGHYHLYRQAVAPLAKAARLDPENYESHFDLGLSYFNLKDYQDARRPLERAVELRPESFEAVAVLGSTLFALGDDYSAARALSHAHELRPAEAKVAALLFEELRVIAQHLLATRDYKQAVTYFKQALELRPDAGELHLQLAQAYDALGESAKAQAEHQASEQRSAGQR